MKVQYLGQSGDPDIVTQFGFRFERKGDPVDVPDTHPQAQKFVGNKFFKCAGKGVKDFTGDGWTAPQEQEILQPPGPNKPLAAQDLLDPPPAPPPPPGPEKLVPDAP